MLQQYLGGFNARLRCSDTMLNLGEPEVEQEREREREYAPALGLLLGQRRQELLEKNETKDPFTIRV